MPSASFRSGAGRQWSRAAPMPAMPGRRRIVRGAGEVHGSPREAWRWLCGSGVTREGELCVGPTMAGRRRSDGHAGARCPLFYMRPSKVVRAASLLRHVRGMGTAWRRACAEYDGDAVGRAAHGRLGLAKARTARGARGVGKEGGAAPGVPRRANRQTKAGLGRRVRRRAGRPSWSPRRDTARVGARSGVPGAKRFGLALFH
jgi:hypothetical protein